MNAVSHKGRLPSTGALSEEWIKPSQPNGNSSEDVRGPAAKAAHAGNSSGPIVLLVSFDLVGSLLRQQ